MTAEQALALAIAIPCALVFLVWIVRSAIRKITRGRAERARSLRNAKLNNRLFRIDPRKKP